MTSMEITKVKSHSAYNKYNSIDMSDVINTGKSQFLDDTAMNLEK